ncbi:hypothetical protein GF325_17815 [Candidatus Bathyarchaeota archaeon]|nr:hypothetical protein [Candidatus Bathyarchaeota archaeon]
MQQFETFLPILIVGGSLVLILITLKLVTVLLDRKGGKSKNNEFKGLPSPKARFASLGRDSKKDDTGKGEPAALGFSAEANSVKVSRCRNCGWERNDPGSEYCGNCGNRLN